MFVLMHALSSDTRLIYVTTISLFDNFDQDFDMSLETYDSEDSDDEPDGFQRKTLDLRERLRPISYTLTDDELLTFVNTIAVNYTEASSRGVSLSGISIATHFGWGKVDKRRKKIISEHLGWPKQPRLTNSEERNRRLLHEILGAYGGH